MRSNFYSYCSDVFRQRRRLDLLEGALLGVLVGAKADELRPVTEAVAGDMIVAHLDDELRFDRLPFSAPFGAPTARTARGFAGETRRGYERFEFPGQRRPLRIGDGGGETHMVEPAVFVVEPEQQRADKVASALVAEAAHHAIGGAQAFDLEHVALAREVGPVASLGDDAVKRAARVVEPTRRLLVACRAGGELQPLDPARRGKERLERGAALDQRLRHDALA